MTKTYPPEATLLELRQNHTNIEIAEKYGVSTSTVKRWIRSYNIPHREKNTTSHIINERKKPSPQTGLGLMDRARSILGSRLTEDRIGYKLDGRYARTDSILKAANLAIKL